MGKTMTRRQTAFAEGGAKLNAISTAFARGEAGLKTLCTEFEDDFAHQITQITKAFRSLDIVDATARSDKPVRSPCLHIQDNFK
jgi:hypothetical protein